MADTFRPIGGEVLPTDSFRPLNVGPRESKESPQLPSMPYIDADNILNEAIDYIRPFAGSLAGVGAANLVSGVPYVGKALALPAETQGYAGVDTLLQYLKTKDQRPASFGDAIGEGEKQALLNAVGGRVINGLFRVGKGFLNANQPEIYKFAPTTSQALESFGFHALATLPKFAEDMGASGAKAAALDRSGGAGFTQALNFANRLNGAKDIINSDPVRLADKIRETLETGLTSSDEYRNFPVKPKLELFKKPAIEPKPVMPDLPDKEVALKSWGKGYKDSIDTKYQDAVDTIKADYKAQLEQRTVNREKALVDYNDKLQQAKVDYSKNLDQYKSDLSAFQNPTFTPSEEATHILKGGKNPFSKLDDVIQDPDRLSKVLIAGQGLGTNVRKDLQAYQFMKTVNEATTRNATTGAIRIDAQKIKDVFNNPEMNTSLNTLFGKAGRENVEDFIRNIALTQDKTMASGKALRYIGGGFALPITYILDNVAGIPHSAGFTGVYIGTSVLGRLLTKPAVGKVLTDLAGGQSLDMNEKLLGRLLTSALQGLSIALIDGEGKKHWTEINVDPKSGSLKFAETQ